MKRSIYFLVAVILLVGCHQKSSEMLRGNTEIIEIPKQITKSILDITNNYQYITLDVGENIDAALGCATKLRVFRGKLYVMDNVFTNKMLIFDIDGTFFKRVSRPGRGPQEYVNLRTFELDYAREELLIKDDDGDKIIVFDLDGNYKNTIDKQLINGSGISRLSNGNMVYGAEGAVYNETDHKLFICDSLNNIFQQYCEDVTQYKYGHLSQNLLNPSFDGAATFAPQYMNDIYKVSGKGVEQMYKVNFRDMLDPKELEKYDAWTFSDNPVSHKTIVIGNHADSENYFYITYKHDKKDYCVYHNKKNKLAIVSDDRLCARGLTFDEQGNFWGTLTEADLFDDDSEKAIEIKSAIKESGNPVVICYNLK